MASTGVLCVLLGLLLQVVFSAQQQEPNYFFGQSQGRFTPSFQNPRNGFFAADALRPNANNPGAASYQVTNLFLDGDEQQQQQSQLQQQQLLRQPPQQSRLAISNGNQYPAVDNAPSYLKASQYAAFPQRSPNLASSADFFEISPRPFTVAPPPVPSIHSFQFGNRATPTRSPTVSVSPVNFFAQQSELPDQQLRQQFNSQPTVATHSLRTPASDSRLREQLHDETPINNNRPFKTPPKSIRTHTLRPSSQLFPNLPNSDSYNANDDDDTNNDQFYDTRPSLSFPKAPAPTLTKISSSVFHPSEPVKRIKSTTTTTTTSAPESTSPKHANTPTSRRTRFNPYRSVVSPKTRLKSTTTPAPTTKLTLETARDDGSTIIRSQSQHYHAGRPNLIARRPPFVDNGNNDDDDDDAIDDDDADDDGQIVNRFRQPLFKQSVQKTRLMNVPVTVHAKPTLATTTTVVSTTARAATSPSTTSSVAPVLLDQLLEDDDDDVDESDYEDDEVRPVHETDEDNAHAPNDQIKLKDSNVEDDDFDYIRSDINQLEASKPHASSHNNFTPVGNTPENENPEPVILTSNFYLPEGSKNAAPVNDPDDEDEYEFEEYDDDDEVTEPKDTGLELNSSVSSTTPRISSTTPHDDYVFEEEVVDAKVEDSATTANTDNSDEILGEAVISVVTTKSVINGTTLSQNKPKTNNASDSAAEPLEPLESLTNPSETLTESDPANIDANDEAINSPDDTTVHHELEEAEPTATSNNSSTENYLVVASVQTSRSVSGARYLPFEPVGQNEKKQDIHDMKATEEHGDPDDEETTGDIDDVTDAQDDDAAHPTADPAAPTTTEDDTEIIESTDPDQHLPTGLTVSTEISTTVSSTTATVQSTESIIDKLDRVQSELSVGLLSGKFPILNEMPTIAATTTTSTEAPNKQAPPVVIKRFMPRTTATPTSVLQPVRKPSPSAPLPIEFDELPQDDLTASLLPLGFKPRSNNYRNKKLTTTTKSATPSSESAADDDDEQQSAAVTPPMDAVQRQRNASRSFKTHSSIQDTVGPPMKSDEPTKPSAASTKGVSKSFTRAPFVTVQDSININAFLPPGYRPPKTTKKPASVVAVAPPADFAPISDSTSNLRRPDKAANVSTPTTTTTRKPSARIPIAENIAAFLPPGYKAPIDDLPDAIPIADEILSKLLPANYSPAGSNAATSKEATTTSKPSLARTPPTIHKFSESAATTESSSSAVTKADLLNSVLSKVQFKDVSALLPPGFVPPPSTANESEQLETSTRETTKAIPGGGLKVVFPKGIKRPGSGRVTTTAAPGLAGHDGPSSPPVTIRKGLRTTTEFTGWPSPPTTPFSIERLLAQQNAESIDISQLLGKTSTSATPLNTTTSTTTTTTTTVRPTQPGLCRSECDLAGTIRIVDGVVWTPELLDHNTEEWKNLAHEVEAQLNEVYNKSANLSHWYKKIRIDSFSQGSVLVDYFVELQNVTNQLNTLDIKRMFHEALSVAPPPVLPLPPKKAKKSDDDDDESELSSESSSEATPAGNDTDTTESSNSAEESSSSVSVEDIPVRPNMLLGKFVLDPVSTDFIVIPKQNLPSVEQVEPYSLIPQWAIAVIVIGMASLIFVIVFGVAVLVNRQRRSLKKQPVPLTADMLNELNKNHMGGVENYGQEELYQEDAWSDKLNPKQKRFPHSAHDSSSNIYDSWRSQHRRSSLSASPAEPPHNYYDANYYAQKAPSYPPPLPPDPYGLMDAQHSTMMLDHRHQPQPIMPQIHHSQYHQHHHQQMQPQLHHPQQQMMQQQQQHMPYGGGGIPPGSMSQHYGYALPQGQHMQTHRGPSSRRGYQSHDYDPDEF